MHYPIVLDLTDRNVLVVGAGGVAIRKIRALLDAGASVRCVAPYGCPEVKELADGYEIDWEERRFRREDVEGVFLVFATTNDKRVNRFVVETARRSAILANCATDDDCDFFVPATTRRGDIGIAVWTGVPALTARLRDAIHDLLDPRWERAAAMLSHTREQLKHHLDEQSARADVLRKLAAGAPDRFADDEAATAFISETLSDPPGPPEPVD